MSDALARRVRIEIRRCMAAVEHGSPRDFWVRRLSLWLASLEHACAELRGALTWLRER